MPDDDGIRAIYCEHEHAAWARCTADPWSQSRVEETSVRNPAQIYSQHAAFSENLLAHLLEQGFPGETAGSSDEHHRITMLRCLRAHHHRPPG